MSKDERIIALEARVAELERQMQQVLDAFKAQEWQ